MDKHRSEAEEACERWLVRELPAPGTKTLAMVQGFIEGYCRGFQAGQTKKLRKAFRNRDRKILKKLARQILQ